MSDRSQIAGRRMALVALAAVLLVAAFLQLYELGDKSLWDDEAGSVQVARQPTLDATWAAYNMAERQPPLHYLFLHGWIRLAGATETAVRLPFALFSIASVGVLVWLGVRIAGWHVALLAAYLFAISPFVVTYGRMARYYALGGFLALLSTALLVELLFRRRTVAGAIGLSLSYVVTTFLLLMTSYPAIGVVAAQNVFVVLALLACFRKQGASSSDVTTAAVGLQLDRRWPALVVPWLACQVLLGAGYALWMLASRGQLTRVLTDADPRVHQGLQALPLDLLFPLFAYGIGESIFPWHPVAVVTAVLLLVTGVIGLVRIRTVGLAGWLPVVGLLGPLGLTVLAFQLIARDQPFNVVASKAIGAAPHLFLIIAFGLIGLAVRWRALVLAGLTASAVLVNTNYFREEQFINPSYAIPTREIMQLVAGNSRPDDLVLTESDWIVNYYYRPDGGGARLVPTQNAEAVKAALETNSYGRIWLVKLGGYGSTLTPARLEEWLAAHYVPARRWGFARQDATYLQVKQRLLGTREPEYRATVELFERR